MYPWPGLPLTDGHMGHLFSHSTVDIGSHGGGCLPVLAAWTSTPLGLSLVR